MNVIKVVNRVKTAEYIGRGSVLGNPFAMRNQSQAERNRVCEEYQIWFDNKVKSKDPSVRQELIRLYNLAKTRDIQLSCFCAPKRCHGDIIKAFLDKALKMGES